MGIDSQVQAGVYGYGSPGGALQGQLGYSGNAQALHDKRLNLPVFQFAQEADQLGSHPYLWSGYVSIGSTDALIKASWSNVFIISGATLVLILLIVFTLFWVSSRKRA